MAVLREHGPELMAAAPHGLGLALPDVIRIAAKHGGGRSLQTLAANWHALRQHGVTEQRIVAAASKRKRAVVELLQLRP